MDKLIEVVVDELRQRKSFVSDSLAMGHAKDYSEYRAMCGEIRGYSLIEDYIIDLAKRMEQSDDD
jgi:hypothetical protein